METPFRKSFRRQSRHIGPEPGHQVIKTKAKTIITHKRTQSLRQLLKEELYQCPKTKGRQLIAEEWYIFAFINQGKTTPGEE